jgi:uncharacterized protein (TIGR00251 family)
MTIVTPHTLGCVLSVRAQPNARRNAVLGLQADALKVAVAAPPEDGRANAAIAEVLRQAFGLKRSQVELLSGPTHRMKAFLLREMDAEEVLRRVAELVDMSP